MAMAEKMLTPRRSYGMIRITKIRTVKSIIISQSKEAIAIAWIPGSTTFFFFGSRNVKKLTFCKCAGCRLAILFKMISFTDNLQEFC